MQAIAVVGVLYGCAAPQTPQPLQTPTITPTQSATKPPSEPEPPEPAIAPTQSVTKPPSEPEPPEAKEEPPAPPPDAYCIKPTDSKQRAWLSKAFPVNTVLDASGQPFDCAGLFKDRSIAEYFHPIDRKQIHPLDKATYTALKTTTPLVLGAVFLGEAQVREVHYSPKLQRLMIMRQYYHGGSEEGPPDYTIVDIASGYLLQFDGPWYAMSADGRTVTFHASSSAYDEWSQFAKDHESTTPEPRLLKKLAATYRIPPETLARDYITICEGPRGSVWACVKEIRTFDFEAQTTHTVPITNTTKPATLPRKPWMRRLASHRDDTYQYRAMLLSKNKKILLTAYEDYVIIQRRPQRATP